jgi:hypothetical protein
VFDPSGTTPLYGIAVYVPSGPLANIPDGVDVNAPCTSCAAPLSGNPVTVALTDAHGHFQLNNVPAGAQVPFVMQTGKFRRAVVVPMVVACQDNPIGQKDASGAEMTTRLPRKQSEGHLPLIAVTTGACEGLECVLRTFGFDDSEFTSGTGSGRIHLYTGRDGFSTTGGLAGGAVGSTDAYKFWGSTAMYKYDIILNSCECVEFPRDKYGPAYSYMKTYLDHGGRLYTTDFQYNWFTDAPAPPEFKAAADWRVPQMSQHYDGHHFIDTSFPKGKALDDWMQFVFQGNSPPAPGEIVLQSIFENVETVHPGTTRWIYGTPDGKPLSGPDYTTKYLSFNTPFSANLDAGTVTQCGRAVFADIHVSIAWRAAVLPSAFPMGCNGPPKSQQVSAFEFLFFDLSSCVQDDSLPTQQPPIQ